MSGFAEYTEYDGLGLAELVRTRQVAPEEVLEAAIERIEALNPALNAVVTRVYDEARAAEPDGSVEAPFVGVPFLLKDLGGAQAGVPMSAGSRFFAHAPGAGRCRDRGPLQARGPAHPRAHQHAGVRAQRLDRAGAVRPDPQPLGPDAARAAARAAARRPRSPRAWCRSPMPATAAARSASRRPAAACSA